MTTLHLSIPDELLATDIADAVERVWLETMREHSRPHAVNRRRELHSFREFTAFDAKEGTAGEYLPTAHPHSHPVIPSITSAR